MKNKKYVGGVEAMEKAFQSFRKHEKNNPKSKEYDKQFGYTTVKPKRKDK